MEQPSERQLEVNSGASHSRKEQLAMLEDALFNRSMLAGQKSPMDWEKALVAKFGPPDNCWIILEKKCQAFLESLKSFSNAYERHCKKLKSWNKKRARFGLPPATFEHLINQMQASLPLGICDTFIAYQEVSQAHKAYAEELEKLAQKDLPLKALPLKALPLMLLDDILSSQAACEEAIKTIKTFKEQFETCKTIHLPESLHNAFVAYKKAYFEANEEIEKLEKFVEEVASIASLEAPLFYSRAKTNLSLNRALELELASVAATREKEGKNSIISQNDDIFSVQLVPSDFAGDFLEAARQNIQLTLDALSGKLDLVKASGDIHEIANHHSLVQDQEDEDIGLNRGYKLDYIRRSCSFEGQNSPDRKVDSEYRDAMDSFIKMWQAKHFPQYQITPNLRAVLSTMAYQSGLVYLAFSNTSNYLASLCYNADYYKNKELQTFHGVANAAPQNTHHHMTHLRLGDTGVHIEVFLHSGGFLLTPSGEPSSAAALSSPPESYFAKVSCTIQVAFDNGYPTFSCASLDPSLLFVFPQSIVEKPYSPKSFQFMLKENALAKSLEVPSKFLDALRPCLNHIAQFAGYDSLEEFHSTQKGNQKATASHLRELANLTVFNLSFVESLKLKDPSEKAFLEGLYKAFYERHESKDQLATSIFNFVKEQLSSETHLGDVLRYISLLKVAVQLGTNQKTAEGILQIFRNNLESQQLIKLTESLDLKELCEKVLSGKIEQATAKEQIKGFIEKGLKGNKKIIAVYPIDKQKRYDYFTNLAVDYGISLQGKAQKIVESLCTRIQHCKELLFQQALANIDIYRELVEPKITVTYLWRRFRELLPKWLGGIDPRPRFTLEEHAKLIKKHPEVLFTEDSNPYRAKLNALAPSEKLKFLTEYRSTKPGEIKIAIAQQLDHFGPAFFEDIKEHANKFFSKFQPAFFEPLIQKGDPAVVRYVREKMPELAFHPVSASQNLTAAEFVKEGLQQIVEACKKDSGSTALERYGEAFINQIRFLLEGLFLSEAEIKRLDYNQGKQSFLFFTDRMKLIENIRSENGDISVDPKRHPTIVEICKIFKKNAWLYKLFTEVHPSDKTQQSQENSANLVTMDSMKDSLEVAPTPKGVPPLDIKELEKDPSPRAAVSPFRSSSDEERLQTSEKQSSSNGSDSATPPRTDSDSGTSQGSDSAGSGSEDSAEEKGHSQAGSVANQTINNEVVDNSSDECQDKSSQKKDRDAHSPSISTSTSASMACIEVVLEQAIAACSEKIKEIVANDAATPKMKVKTENDKSLTEVPPKSEVMVSSCNEEMVRDRQFIDGLEEGSEKTFLNSLYEQLYEKNQSRDGLAESVFGFIIKQLSSSQEVKLSCIECLLKAAVNLGGSSERAAEILTVHKFFNHQPIGDLEKKGEKVFLEKLRKQFYEENQSRDELSESIFKFVEAQLSASQKKGFSYSTAKEYAYLLQFAIDLGGSSKRAVSISTKYTASEDDDKEALRWYWEGVLGQVSPDYTRSVPLDKEASLPLNEAGVTYRAFFKSESMVWKESFIKRINAASEDAQEKLHEAQEAVNHYAKTHTSKDLASMQESKGKEKVSNEERITLGV